MYLLYQLLRGTALKHPASSSLSSPGWAALTPQGPGQHHCPTLSATTHLQLSKSVQKLVAGAQLHVAVVTGRWFQASSAYGRLLHRLGCQALGTRERSPGRLLTGKKRNKEEDETL